MAIDGISRNSLDRAAVPDRQVVPDRRAGADQQEGLDRRAEHSPESRTRAEYYNSERAADAAAQPAPDHPEGEDAVWQWKGLELTAAENHIADQALAVRREAEGRDDLGEYGERGITPAMRRVESELTHGQLAPDTEKYALKTPDRFKEKLARMIERRPDASADELVDEIHDGIRYTFIFDDDHYAHGVEEASASLKGNGYELVKLRNYWDGAEYKGVNSRWRDPESDQLFEVQFHTLESWDAKQKTHNAYEKVEDSNTSVGEVARLREYQAELSRGIPLPDGWARIHNYR
jgi:hypothetical protein